MRSDAEQQPAAWRIDTGRLVMALAVSVAVACAGGDEGAAVDTSQVGAGAGAPAAPPTDAPPGTFTDAEVTPQMVALGDSIFAGAAAGGICYTCHGPEAQGTQIGPNLTDQAWLNGDGSLDFIANVIRTGVPQPTQYPGPMPPFAQSLTDEQIRAVTAYVYSRSHPNVGSGGA